MNADREELKRLLAHDPTLRQRLKDAVDRRKRARVRSAGRPIPKSHTATATRRSYGRKPAHD